MSICLHLIIGIIWILSNFSSSISNSHASSFSSLVLFSTHSTTASPGSLNLNPVNISPWGIAIKFYSKGISLIFPLIFKSLRNTSGVLFTQSTNLSSSNRAFVNLSNSGLKCAGWETVTLLPKIAKFKDGCCFANFSRAWIWDSVNSRVYSEFWVWAYSWRRLQTLFL